MKAGKPVLTAVAVVSAAVLAGCSVQIAGTAEPSGGSAAPGSATPTSTRAAGVPAALQKYYGQKITWGSCAAMARADDIAEYDKNRLECGNLTVPIDYDDPSAGETKLAVARVPASGQRRGSLLMNPGGPGGSGVQQVAGKSMEADKYEISSSFDLVGWDPRGVGASSPAVKCFSDKQRDENRLSTLAFDNSPAGIAKQEAFNKSQADLCAEKMGKTFLANVGTADTVRDLDVLRAVLGDEKLTYLGYSYGTFIGAIYAETFPERVRAMVLDGAVDPAQDQITSNVQQMAGFQTVFDDWAKDCARYPDCPVGTDPGQATARYQQLVRPLIDKTVRGQGGRQLSYSDATTATIQAMYAQQLWEPLRRGLTGLRRGDGSLLQRIADLYLNRDELGRYSPMMDANTAINCVDGPAVTDPADLARLDTEIRKAAPFLDDGRGTGRGAKSTCAFWAAAPTLKPHEVNAVGAPRAVVVSTTHDPATPYENGVNLARQMGASLISFEGSQHTVSLEGNACVDDAVTAYLRDLTLPAEGLRCTA
ncbi:alpha/beta hydrolase [Tsukamurella paurometabola]|uniref:Alpha/beta fold hydrolase n=1 Tax=Tsukamurella paurometabola TaxID=2061 RepID=A0A3P8MD81_TSUPA|nr:alpha/beta hydrolase [Tsukamurella paurometabola]MBS4102736.1 alpha/beta fold hydrolase [Tsukamurella paurometabola]UEA82991.1 alpha/beta hydrolase [Tsukamurella paurometabola]VDR40076.1 Tripeptidyl aminopeptidase precursor [Tsukamurella paurometabola]